LVDWLFLGTISRCRRSPARRLAAFAAPLVAELEAELPPDVVAAAQERGRARDLEATVAELLVELGE
jgi:hypothetical protein